MGTDEPRFRPDRLIKLIERQFESDRQVAAIADVGQDTISLLRNGKRPQVSAVSLAKLARALDCTVDYLMGTTDSVVRPDLQLPPYGMDVLNVMATLPVRRCQEVAEYVAMVRGWEIKQFPRFSAALKTVDKLLWADRSLPGREAAFRSVMKMLGMPGPEDEAGLDEANGIEHRGSEDRISTEQASADFSERLRDPKVQDVLHKVDEAIAVDDWIAVPRIVGEYDLG